MNERIAMPPARAAESWPDVSRLLDEALAMEAAARAAWLASLPPTPAKAAVERLLGRQAHIESADFLGTLPPLSPAALARIDADPGAPALQPGDEIGPWRLLRPLGQGGMGAVWLAEKADGSLKRQVALKLPNRTWNAALAERMLRERDILASLTHPHIAHLYDAGFDAQGRPYLALECVDGSPIDQFVRAQALGPRAIVRLLLQVAQAVAHAHSRLVIHRDLKPNNILVDTRGQVRLLDFGIAKLVEGEGTEETALTRAAGHVLTPEYASPEQVSAAPLTTSSDVYSLAVVAFELLAGCRPYRLKRGTLLELEEAIAHADPPRASEAATDLAVRKALRGDLDAILNKALKKRPEERYATVVAFAEDLQRHLDGHAVLARPDSRWYVARKFVARHRVPVAAAVAAVAALGIGLGAALWQAHLAQQQASRAESIKTFVLSFFEAADIERGGNRTMSAVDLLKSARQRFDAASITDPAIQVELLTTIGSGLFGLGEAQLAAPVLEQAVGLAATKLGQQHPAAAGASLAYGSLLQVREGCRVAARHFDAAERVLRRTGDMARLSGALRGQSCALLHEGQPERAIAVAWEAVRAAEQQPAPVDQRILIMAYSHVANVLSVSRRKGGLEAARRAVELSREVYAERPNKLSLEARMMYASALGEESDLEGAVHELESVAEQQSKVLGPDHADRAYTLGEIAVLLLRLGDPIAGAERAQEALRIALAQNGGKPTAELGTMRAFIGMMYLNARRNEQALAQYRQADRDVAAFYDAEHDMARGARSGIARALTRLGRLDEAEGLLTRLLARPSATPANDAFHQGRLGQLRSAQGRHDEAVALLRDVPSSLPAGVSAMQDRNRALSLMELGEVLLAAERFAEALQALQEARPLLLKSLRNGSPDLAEISIGIARAQLALRNPMAALAAASEAATFWERYDPNQREHGIALVWHARALAAAGHAPASVQLLHRARPIIGSTGLPGDRELLAQAQREVSASARLARRGATA
jgi:tetratricopeptide (TPR) repeat protein